MDFTTGGGGDAGVIDPTERGLPGVEVEAVQEGAVAGTGTTGPDGRFLISGLAQGEDLATAIARSELPRAVRRVLVAGAYPT